MDPNRHNEEQPQIEDLDLAINLAFQQKLHSILTDPNTDPKTLLEFMKLEEKRRKLQKKKEQLAKLEAKVAAKSLHDARMEPNAAAVFWDGQLVVTKRAKGKYQSYLVSFGQLK